MCRKKCKRSRRKGGWKAGISSDAENLIELKKVLSGSSFQCVEIRSQASSGIQWLMPWEQQPGLAGSVACGAGNFTVAWSIQCAHSESKRRNQASLKCSRLPRKRRHPTMRRARFKAATRMFCMCAAIVKSVSVHDHANLNMNSI